MVVLLSTVSSALFHQHSVDHAALKERIVSGVEDDKVAVLSVGLNPILSASLILVGIRNVKEAKGSVPGIRIAIDQRLVGQPGLNEPLVLPPRFEEKCHLILGMGKTWEDDSSHQQASKQDVQEDLDNHPLARS